MVNAPCAFIEYSEYIHPVFDDRRASGNTDDLVGVLCHAEIDGDSLDDDSLVHETLLILIGGDETTRHVISGGVEELLAHPDQAARLAADPAGLMPGAVEEMLRWVSPIKNMARTATRDVELAGAHIRAGQELLLLYPSANRDEAVFEDPDPFDITRSPNPHMAFGFGAHFCLGNQLARLELRVMVERVLARTARPAPRRRAGRAAAAAGQLHLRDRADARGVHAQRPRRASAPSDARAAPPDRQGSPAGPSSSPAAAAASGWPPPSGWPPTARTSRSAGAPSRSWSTPRSASRRSPPGGATARYVVADVTVEEQVAAAVAATAGGHGPHRRPLRLRRRLDCTSARSSTADVDAVRATIDLNLMGSVICVKQGAAAMQAQGGPGFDRAHVLGRRPLPASRTSGPTGSRRPASAS